MKGFFSIDGAFYRFFSRLWDMIVISVMWVVFSIPIVTFGASTVAAFSVTMKMIDDEEGYVGRQFWAAFKSNLKNGIPLGLIFLACLELVYLDAQLFNAVEGNPIILLISAIVAGFCVFMGFIYAFPLSARYENTVIRTIKLSSEVATRYFLRTLFLAILVALLILLAMYNYTTMFIALFIGPGCIFLTISGFAVPFFREIEKKDGVTYKSEEIEKANKREED